MLPTASITGFELALFACSFILIGYAVVAYVRSAHTVSDRRRALWLAVAGTLLGTVPVLVQIADSSIDSTTGWLLAFAVLPLILAGVISVFVQSSVHRPLWLGAAAISLLFLVAGFVSGVIHIFRV